jgi:hypothetical protein
MGREVLLINRCFVKNKMVLLKNKCFAKKNGLVKHK